MSTGPARDNPLDLLRAALAGLNSPESELSDQAQLDDLLAEAGEALQRAKVVSHAVTQCEQSLAEGQFEKSLEALDAALRRYPTDPALLKRRRQVEEQQKAVQAAAAVQAALDETQWLLNQDRPDLAAHFLKERAAELPEQTALTSRLAEIEALLPHWERDRYVQTALAQAAALEEQQQWQPALTILEGAFESHPDSAELAGAASRLRERLAHSERQRKLARRLERIRQHLADGEPEEAEQVLLASLEALGPEPALQALRAEVEAERSYRESLLAAQMLFGRHDLQEAERVLMPLATENRSEAQALLAAVRQARAAFEEETFFERGREKALKLIEQQQIAAAADLLRNLLSLFPSNPILERDLLAAQTALPQAASADRPAPGETAAPGPVLVSPAAPEPVAETRAPEPGPARITGWRFRWAAIAAAALALASATAAAWKLSHTRVAAAPPVARSVAKLAPAAPTAIPAPIPQEIPLPPPPQEPLPPVQPAPPLATHSSPPVKPAKPVSRPFVPPVATASSVPPPSAALPLPPGTVAIISSDKQPPLPAALTRPLSLPTPPAPSQPADSPPATPPARPAVPGGGVVQQPQLIERVAPVYPALARQRGITGVVRMQATIDEQGAIQNVKLLKGDPVLASSAQSALLKWKYRPATLDGRPITTTIVIQFLFEEPK